MIASVLLLVPIAAALPAGDAYAFLAPADGVWQVWVADGTGEPRVATDEAVDMVYLSFAAETGELLAVAADGSARVLDASGKLLERMSLGLGADEAALSPDGRRVVYSRPEADTGSAGRDLWLLDRASGESRPFVRRAGFQRSPAWTRDATAVVFVSDGTGGAQDVWLHAVDGSREVQLTVGGHAHLDPAPAPDGSVYVSADRDGDWDVWRIDPADGTAQRITSVSGLDGQPAVSGDGSRLLWVGRRDSRAAVWTAAASGGDARRLSPELAGVRHPVWRMRPVPQGRIAFLRVTDGAWQPWTARPDGSDQRRLPELPADVSRLTASRDGSRVLANTNDGELWLLDAAAGTRRQIAIEPAGTFDAALSPDGQRIAFSVATLGGIDTNDIWLVGVEGGLARKLTSQAALQHYPVWRSDHELLYLSGAGGQVHDVWTVEIDSGRAAALLEDHRYNFEPAAAPGGDVVVSSNRAGGWDLWLIQAPADPRRITDTAATESQPAFSPDGRHVAYVVQGDHGRGTLWLLDLTAGVSRAVPIEGSVRMPVWTTGVPG